ncbi:hypothetical protein [Lacinutrix sp. Hel_I_90]|uniref:hypothetical protein n=1 Tax=Lacinutrix sp. Hel_I_90 TaxID=1249999 RepID=UPI0018CF9F3C|nr:hypothetical protein [Lacinutrix sp. Hel_I_90]
MKFVIQPAGFTNLFVNKQIAAAKCDHLMAQAKIIPKGANPTSSKYRLPKSVTPPLNIPPTP